MHYPHPGTHGTWLPFWQKCLFQSEIFSLAASWQMACKFLSNTLSLSIPWIFSEINYHWIFTKMGRQKSKSNFLCLSNRRYIYIAYMPTYGIICFCFIMPPALLPPFLYHCKWNRSFLRTFLSVKTILTFDIFVVVEPSMLSLLPSLLHGWPSIVTNPLWHLSFSSISFQVTVFNFLFVFLSDQFVRPVFMFDFQ